MKITDVLKIDNSIVAYCSGDNIPTDIENSIIEVSGKRFQVGKYQVLVSISGMRNAVMELLNIDNLKEIPFGEVKVLTNIMH